MIKTLLSQIKMNFYQYLLSLKLSDSYRRFNYIVYSNRFNGPYIKL